MIKKQKDQFREEEKYYSKEFNDFIEHQDISHKLNLTRQQEKYEAKRQYNDFMFLKERTLNVKHMVDSIIAKHHEHGQSNSTEMNELYQMQISIRKCIHDLEKGEQLKPSDLDTYNREVQNKNTFILDWQIQDKKITEIENKLKDREYCEFVKYKVNEEVDQINMNYMRK